MRCGLSGKIRLYFTHNSMNTWGGERSPQAYVGRTHGLGIRTYLHLILFQWIRNSSTRKYFPESGHPTSDCISLNPEIRNPEIRTWIISSSTGIPDPSGFSQAIRKSVHLIQFPWINPERFWINQDFPGRSGNPSIWFYFPESGNPDIRPWMILLSTRIPD